mmetsp:Transcript_134143/g.416902  ORF Transcript_134143/g.416902 Transcript_134143/m.416902 type:complete len:245 (-) Transcript_134143:21-755(-)
MVMPSGMLWQAMPMQMVSPSFWLSSADTATAIPSGKLCSVREMKSTTASRHMLRTLGFVASSPGSRCICSSLVARNVRTHVETTPERKRSQGPRWCPLLLPQMSSVATVTITPAARLSVRAIAQGGGPSGMAKTTRAPSTVVRPARLAISRLGTASRSVGTFDRPRLWLSDRLSSSDPPAGSEVGATRPAESPFGCLATLMASAPRKPGRCRTPPSRSRNPTEARRASGGIARSAGRSFVTGRP